MAQAARSKTVSRAARPMRMLVSPVEQFLKTESASGIILIGAAVVAFIWANSPLAPAYDAMREAETGVRLGAFALEKPLTLWVNDLLMAIFFFLVGLEIKREFMVGELAGFEKAVLPIAGAIGGMVIPAGIYVLMNIGSPLISGWGVPMATDIAFAVGVLALLGSRVPLQLKVMLLALAIVDDLGAVLVIALFYTADVNLTALAISLGIWVVALLYGRSNGGSAVVFTLLGLVMWYFMLKSGVHATIAGVLLAFAVPLVHPMSSRQIRDQLKMQANDTDFERAEIEIAHLETVLERARSPLHHFEHGLAPYVAFLIMPIFALFNAGVSIMPTGEASLLSSATYGAFAGLLLGKPIGITLAVAIVILTGIARMPKGASWLGFVGLGLLAGIGFTMSLFIANLAFADPAALAQAKIGVLAASVVAAILGLIFLRMAYPATRA